MGRKVNLPGGVSDRVMSSLPNQITSAVGQKSKMREMARLICRI